jgi:two-component system chemotaxis response regulator CheY
VKRETYLVECFTKDASRFTRDERRGEAADASRITGVDMGKQILVVDDSVTMRQMVSFTLTSAGFEVIEAGDGQEAVGKLNGGARPNLVITDLNMPKMDGISLIKAVRAMPTLKLTPILMLTTESDETKKKEGQTAGATGWIVKPFNPEQMLKVIAKVMPA